MPLLHVALVIIVAGVLLWLVDSFVPMRAQVKKILTAVVVIALVLWLISLFFGSNFLNIHVGG